MFNIKQLNRKKNHLLRHLKTRLMKLFVDHKKPHPIIVSQINHLLFIHNDNKLGDLILATAAFQAAKQAGYRVSLWISPQTVELVKYSPYVDQIIVEPKGWLQKIRQARQLRQQSIDLLIDVSDELKANKLLIISQIKARYCLGYAKDNYQLYDISIKQQHFIGQHMSYRYQLLFDFLEQSHVKLNYAVTPDPNSELFVTDFLASFKRPIWVINPFAASHHRELSVQQLATLLKKIAVDYPTVTPLIIGTPKKLAALQQNKLIFQTLPQNNLMTTISLIKHADLILSPDTAIVHLAAAFSKPLIALYRLEKNTANQSITPNTLLWGPNNPQAQIVYTVQPDTDISTLSVDTIYAAIQQKYPVTEITQ